MKNKKSNRDLYRSLKKNLCLLTLFFCTVNLINYFQILKMNQIASIWIRNSQSGYYLFKSVLEFTVKPKPIKYYTQRNKNCVLCNYSGTNPLANSTPRDVVITFASKAVCNLVPFQRTLRTCGCNATLVILLDDRAYNSLDEATKKFTEDCHTQIILTPNAPIRNRHPIATKCFMLHLAFEFLRENELLINRVIFDDLFDTLFQEDPFSTNFPKDKLHMTHENWLNKDNEIYPKWFTVYDKNFALTPETRNLPTINSGYFGAPVGIFIAFINEILKILAFDGRHDQGAVNYLILTGRLKKANITLTEDDFNDRVRHLYFRRPEAPFPNVSGHLNSSLRASVLHCYYAGNDNFMLSILKACPRPSSEMENYIVVKKTAPLSELEKRVKSFKITKGMIFHKVRKETIIEKDDSYD